MDIKIEIKEEPCFLDFSSENERELSTRDLINKVKIETSDSDTKPELEEGSPCSQHHLVGFNEGVKESEIGTKIDIKEKNWWLEGTSYVNGNIKDETHEDFYSTKPPSENKECVSSYTSDLGNDIIFNMKKDGPECDRDRKYQSQKGLVTDISSNDTSASSENCNNGKIVSMTSCLKQSKLVHQGTKPHKCNICDKNFVTLGYLKRHKRIHEGIKQHKCNICNKTFTRLRNLIRHKLIHEGIKPHKLIHNGIMPHKCEICCKTYSTLSSLKIHKLIHQGIKPHKCIICDKAFTQMSSLKEHKLLHAGVKPYKCDICNKTFTRLSRLKMHKFVHEGTMPNKCNVCNRTFTHTSSLKRHINSQGH